MSLEGRVSIITGAARGIGFACAERFAREGAVVVVADIDEELGRARVKSLEERHWRAAFLRTDVTSTAELRHLVEETARLHGRVDIFVSNAGVTHAAEFLDLREEDYDRVMTVNLKSMVFGGQAAARQMIKQGSRGVIINMASVNSVLAIPNQVPYVVSKGGIKQLTAVMALALAPHGIRVNAIGPGTISTDMARGAVLTSEQALRTILSRIPLGRLGESAEVAAVAAFLAGDDASYMTGQTIFVDGGRLPLNYTVPVVESRVRQ